MIPRIHIAEAGRHVGETVEIAGWLYNMRRSGKIAFPILRDGYGHDAVRGSSRPICRKSCSKPSRISHRNRPSS